MVTPKTRHREVQGSNPMREMFLFILCFCRFGVCICFFCLGVRCLFVCLFLLMTTVNRRGRYYY